MMPPGDEHGPETRGVRFQPALAGMVLAAIILAIALVAFWWQ